MKKLNEIKKQVERVEEVKGVLKRVAGLFVYSSGWRYPSVKIKTTLPNLDGIMYLDVYLNCQDETLRTISVTVYSKDDNATIAKNFFNQLFNKEGDHTDARIK